MWIGNSVVEAKKEKSIVGECHAPVASYLNSTSLLDEMHPPVYWLFDLRAEKSPVLHTVLNGRRIDSPDTARIQAVFSILCYKTTS